MSQTSGSKRCRGGEGEHASRLDDEIEYYPLTTLPVGGWLQPCKYCRQFTAGTVTTMVGETVAVCRRDQKKFAQFLQIASGAQGHTLSLSKSSIELSEMNGSFKTVLIQSSDLDSEESPGTTSCSPQSPDIPPSPAAPSMSPLNLESESNTGKSASSAAVHMPSGQSVRS